jgi:hypothetical protein
LKINERWASRVRAQRVSIAIETPGSGWTATLPQSPGTGSTPPARGVIMRVTVKPASHLFRRQFDWLQFKVALVWCATIFGVAIAAKASSNFIYELLVLFVGFNMSWAVIDASARKFRRDTTAIDGQSPESAPQSPELSPVALAEETASSRPGSHTS